MKKLFKPQYPQPIKALGQKALKSVADKKGALNLALFTHWQEFLPDNLKGQCELIRIKWPPITAGADSQTAGIDQQGGQSGAATLAIRVPNSAIAFTAKTRSIEILSAINRFFGFRLAENLTIKTEPLKRNPQPLHHLDITEQEIASTDTDFDETISDERLRTSLKKLQILRDKRKKQESRNS